MATVTPISNNGSLSISCFTRISSINGLVAQGGTIPAARLMTIRINPMNNNFLRGHTMVLKTWPMVTLFLEAEVDLDIFWQESGRITLLTQSKFLLVYIASPKMDFERTLDRIFDSVIVFYVSVLVFWMDAAVPPGAITG